MTMRSPIGLGHGQRTCEPMNRISSGAFFELIVSSLVVRLGRVYTLLFANIRNGLLVS